VNGHGCYDYDNGFSCFPFLFFLPCLTHDTASFTVSSRIAYDDVFYRILNLFTGIVSFSYTRVYAYRAFASMELV
jgi:hypothetical protein